MASADPSELIEIYHPDLPGDQTTMVPLSSYEAVWSQKGWVPVSERGAVENADADPVAVSGLNDSPTEAQLRAREAFLAQRQRDQGITDNDE